MLNQYSVDNIGILELIVPTSHSVRRQYSICTFNEVYYLKQAFPLVIKMVQYANSDIKMQNISKDS